MSQKIDSEAIKQLANILKETGLSEIEYECQGARIYIAKNNHTIHSNQIINHSENITEQPKVTKENIPNDAFYVRSPMVGTVYLSPEPGSPTFISIGTKVKAGDTLLIVEAMKVMNPIKSTKDGSVSKILVQDGKPVEYDEALVIID